MHLLARLASTYLERIVDTYGGLVFRRCQSMVRPPRREAPARRAPLPSPAAVTVVNRHRCSPLEETHPLDERHCIHQQRPPSPTNADALQRAPMLASPRRSTSSTSATASPSSSHRRQPTPMRSSRGEAPARRAPLHPTAVTVANQRRCPPPALCTVHSQHSLTDH